MINSKFKIQNSKLFGIVVLSGIFLFSAGPVLAICEGPIVPCGGEGNPCQFCHIFVLFNNIVNFVLTCLTPIIAGLMLIIGGLYLLIAGGSPQLFTRAKSIITTTVIGLVIIFVAWVFLNTFFAYIGLANWSEIGMDLTKWWEIPCPDGRVTPGIIGEEEEEVGEEEEEVGEEEEEEEEPIPPLPPVPPAFP